MQRRWLYVFLVLPIPLRDPSLVCLHSPHPVKPLSAAPVEGSPDRKSARSSLSTALSSGLEKLKTVTSGSVQPVAPAPQIGQAVETKILKVRPSGVLRGHQTRSCGPVGRALGRVLGGWSKEEALGHSRSPEAHQPSLAVDTENSRAQWWWNGGTGAVAGRPAAALELPFSLSLGLASGLRCAGPVGQVLPPDTR